MFKNLALLMMLLPVAGFSQGMDIEDVIINRLMLHYQTSDTLINSQFKAKNQ